MSGTQSKKKKPAQTKTNNQEAARAARAGEKAVEKATAETYTPSKNVVAQLQRWINTHRAWIALMMNVIVILLGAAVIAYSAVEFSLIAGVKSSIVGVPIVACFAIGVAVASACLARRMLADDERNAAANGGNLDAADEMDSGPGNSFIVWWFKRLLLFQCLVAACVAVAAATTLDIERSELKDYFDDKFSKLHRDVAAGLDADTWVQRKCDEVLAATKPLGVLQIVLCVMLLLAAYRSHRLRRRTKRAVNARAAVFRRQEEYTLRLQERKKAAAALDVAHPFHDNIIADEHIDAAATRRVKKLEEKNRRTAERRAKRAAETQRLRGNDAGAAATTTTTGSNTAAAAATTAEKAAAAAARAARIDEASALLPPLSHSSAVSSNATRTSTSASSKK
jgi:uncharacterized integral membrane protein